jgi:signal transduction histidine kinase
MDINPVHLLNHQIIRDLPFGVIVVDRHRNISDWNAWMEKCTGLPRPRVQGQPFQAVFPEIPGRNALDQIGCVFGDGEIVQIPSEQMEQFLNFSQVPNHEEIQGMVQDTEMRPLFDLEGEVAAVCILIHDVTDRVHRLRELERLNHEFTIVNSSLDEANRIKGEFLSTVSHELRTPLTAILGFLEILENDLAESVEEEREFLANIRMSATQLLEVINGILQATAIESSKLEINIEALSLVEILHEAQANNHLAARHKNLDFIIHSDDMDLELLADQRELGQVLSNVIGNALKFTDEGSIQMRAYRSPRNPQLVVIEIRDTGIGIDPSHLPLVFEPFRQADSSATRRHSGTGLGLSISKGLMERMNGTIEIESEGLGKGTSVRLILPAAN